MGVDGSILLIDFEYASNNDRLYDLGIWSGEMFFPESIDRELIEAYFGRYDEALYARLVVHKALADVKWSTWALVQSRISTLDFDFVKLRHLEAHAGARHHVDPRWPTYLKALRPT